jgi:hypothetical protein
MKVEKNIPLPSKYPFAKMAIGDSFAVPPNIKRTTVSVSAARFAAKHGAKFTVRQMPDRTLRCWRVA